MINIKKELFFVFCFFEEVHYFFPYGARGSCCAKLQRRHYKRCGRRESIGEKVGIQYTGRCFYIRMVPERAYYKHIGRWVAGGDWEIINTEPYIALNT